jgi:hypothetical protein
VTAVGQTFLTAVEDRDDVTVQTAAHEMSHSPVGLRRRAATSAQAARGASTRDTA